MKLLLQGMRRSGTTIAFDCFVGDSRVECLYEPLAAMRKESVGGGSGAHGSDLFGTVRDKRDAFLAAHPGVDASDLNYGAPRDPRLELERELDRRAREYLEWLLATETPQVVKFTRMAAKTHVLAEIAPRAVFVHLVRDPRAVAASYLFGKGGRHRDRFDDSDEFFERRSSYSAWSSKPLSDALLELPENRHLGAIPDVARILLLWRHHARLTHAGGQRHFGERYVVVRHEDFTLEPERYANRLYEALGLDVLPDVADWVRRAVRAPSHPYAAEDQRWVLWFDRLAMGAELEALGYST